MARNKSETRREIVHSFFLSSPPSEIWIYERKNHKFQYPFNRSCFKTNERLIESQRMRQTSFSLYELNSSRNHPLKIWRWRARLNGGQEKLRRIRSRRAIRESPPSPRCSLAYWFLLLPTAWRKIIPFLLVSPISRPERPLRTSKYDSSLGSPLPRQQLRLKGVATGDH